MEIMSTNFYIEGTTQATVKRAILKSWACKGERWDSSKYGMMASAGRGRVWVLDVPDESVEYVKGRLLGISHTYLVMKTEGQEHRVLSKPQQYVRLMRLGRNLKPGDEMLVQEILSHGRQTARVRVTKVEKGRRAHFSGKQQYNIYHDGLINKSPLFSNMPWSNPMVCGADDDYTIYRPIGG